ncbi:MAG TPA: hypothetical protein RMH99_15385 [Sandaracinaceae bacterium LLY-WYZ-13_1]|nr:hypothetical protein [Sandaracinaceae bacterium LLY-WYZ-13_1]
MTARRSSRLRPRSRRAWLAALVLACSAAPVRALAQEGEDEEGGFDSFAEHIANSMAPTWGGPRTPWPERRPRPEAAGVLRAPLAPVAVQVGPGVEPALAERAVDALARAHDWMARHDWPMPVPDGGYGGTAGFDLYLVPSPLPPEAPGAEPTASDEEPAPERAAWVSYDAPVHWRALDTVDAFGVIATDRVDPARIEPCVVSTYVRGALLSHDPAEARAWRLATGDFVAFLLTGRFGCSDEGIVSQQRQSWRTWIGHAPVSGEGGALFLAMLSARTDGLTGDFIRDLWSGAAQLTWEGDELRASPDMWQVVHTVMEVGQDPLLRLLEEMGVSRYFAGAEERAAAANLPVLRELPDEASVPVLATTAFENLPRRFEPHGLELEPLGSAYVLVDTAEAPPGSRLRIWLRGEYGVRWALSAVRLGEDGAERGRTRAPVRTTMPRSYIPLELTDGETARVLVVVTNLGGRLVDADDPDDQVRSFRLILDKVVPGDEGDAPPG